MTRMHSCQNGSVAETGIDAFLVPERGMQMGSRGYIEVNKLKPGYVAGLGMRGDEFDEPCYIAVGAEVVVDDVVVQGIDW